jgi:hypothetical protein
MFSTDFCVFRSCAKKRILRRKINAIDMPKQAYKGMPLPASFPARKTSEFLAAYPSPIRYYFADEFCQLPYCA